MPPLRQLELILIPKQFNGMTSKNAFLSVDVTRLADKDVDSELTGLVDAAIASVLVRKRQTLYRGNIYLYPTLEVGGDVFHALWFVTPQALRNGVGFVGWGDQRPLIPDHVNLTSAFAANVTADELERLREAWKDPGENGTDHGTTREYKFEFARFLPINTSKFASDRPTVHPRMEVTVLAGERLSTSAAGTPNRFRFREDPALREDPR